METTRCFDGLALNNAYCDFAFGDTSDQHGMGNWSDGTPVRVLEVTLASSTSAVNINDQPIVSLFPNPTLNQCNVYDKGGVLIICCSYSFSIVKCS